MYYVYVLQSEDRSKRYIGYTSDLKKRIKAHNSNHMGYTGKNKWKLVYYEAYLSEEDAMDRERRLKDDGRARYQLMKRIECSLKL